MPKVEVLADYGDLCGECPIWDAARERLYWTDITARRFLMWSHHERKSTILSTDFEVAGFALSEKGGFLVTNSTGFWRWDGAANRQLIADAVDGKACVLNDCVADPEGRLFSGSCFYDGTDGYPLGYLFRLDLDRSVQL